MTHDRATAETRAKARELARAHGIPAHRTLQTLLAHQNGFGHAQYQDQIDALSRRLDALEGGTPGLPVPPVGSRTPDPLGTDPPAPGEFPDPHPQGTRGDGAP